MCFSFKQTMGVLLALAVGLLSSGSVQAQGSGDGGSRVRADSYIRKNEPFPLPLDLRGTYAKIRDDEMVKHVRRLAKLERMAALAKTMDDGSLQEEVEGVRRLEMERHHKVMLRFETRMRNYHQVTGQGE